MVNPGDRQVQKEKSPEGLLAPRSRCDLIFPESGDCFCLVEIYHLCSHGDHIQIQHMSCQCHGIDHKYPFLDILALTNILPSYYFLTLLRVMLPTDPNEDLITQFN